MKKILFLFHAVYFLLHTNFTKAALYVTDIKGVYLFDSTSTQSKKLVALPYNSELVPIAETKIIYTEGILTGEWIKVKFQNFTGYCQSLALCKNKLPDTSALRKMAMDEFFEKTVEKHYFHKVKNEEYHVEDSIFIHNISVSKSYLLLKLYLKNDFPFPNQLDSDEYHLKDCILQIKHSYCAKSSELDSLSLNWIFDGGNTRMTILQMKKNVSVKIDYYPD